MIHRSFSMYKSVSVYISKVMNKKFRVCRWKLTHRDYIRVQFSVTLTYSSLGRSEIKINRDSSRVPCGERMAGDQ